MQVQARRFRFIVFMGVVLAFAGHDVLAAELRVAVQESPGAVRLAAPEGVAPLYVDSKDIQPSGIATDLLADDVARVTGKRPVIVHDSSELSGDAVIIGTLGHSALVDQLVSTGKIHVADLQNKWDGYQIQVVEHPIGNVRRALVAVGGNRRGTAYAALTVSQAIGVSPWYWWADVPVPKKSSLYILPVDIREAPAVKYRGIFLNDEAPCLTGWSKEKFGGLNSKMYVHVFELLLRLKANYLWPAMWGSAFNEDDAESPKLANDYGIVMGTSHQEPMLRAQAEFDRRHPGKDWNYATQPELMEKFWREGIRRNKDFESVITIGMRGRNDTPMIEGATVEQSMHLLEKIVARQREILAQEMNPEVTKVPQVWCLYKEVQEYYERGLRVPDDVTLLWSDDNWGDLRRVPTDAERKRSGGAGVYYHFDYVGDPRNYKWINTNTLGKIWEQMDIAAKYGADRIWVVNVGDLKPMEIPIDFFMSMAWNPSAMTAAKEHTFVYDWAVANFGPEHAHDIADLYNWYTAMNSRRKPELLNTGPDGIYSLVNYKEADTVLAECDAAMSKAEALARELPVDEQDAFFELVLHPVKAVAIVNELYILAGRNHLYAAQGRLEANDLAAKVKELFRTDVDLNRQYNQLANGKWDHMMDQVHLGYASWNDPKSNSIPELKEVVPAAVGALGVAVEGSEAAWPGTKEPARLPAFDSFNRQVRTIELFNRGSTPVHFTAAASAPWVNLSATSGTVEKEQPLLVSIDWPAVPDGGADAQVQITSGGTDSVAVSLHAAKPTGVTPASLQGFIEGDGYVSMDAAHFTRKTEAGGANWETIDGNGRTMSACSIFPVTAPSVLPSNGGMQAPSLEYRMYLLDSGPVSVTAYVSPSLNFVPGRGLRFAMAFDDQAPNVIDVLADASHAAWQESVRENVRTVKAPHMIASPGYHTLRIWMVDPGVVFQKFVVDCGGVKPSYLGPPESFLRVAEEGAAR
ncbi:MAG TPA: glycosyl hydrolase 115 family protein [Phycisphaerae bacterium]|nr:glycosyl hydrolase 115 family protein [Phycisphaerae bacterium]